MIQHPEDLLRELEREPHDVKGYAKKGLQLPAEPDEDEDDGEEK